MARRNEGDQRPMTKELKPLPGNLDSVDLPGLEALHSDMLATCSDLGFEPTSDCLQEIGNVEQGRAVVRRLHAEITAWRASKKTVASGDAKSDTGAIKNDGKKPSSKKPETPQQAMARQKKARLERDAAQPKADKAATKKENTVAKKAVKKVSKPKASKVKKSVAKKAGASKPRTRFDDTHKISWIFKGEGNGTREGSGRHERREQLRKHHGKTVAAYMKAGGSTATLGRAVSEKAVKVGA
jgi:hypothetical protein